MMMVVSMTEILTEFLVCKKIFCVMYCKIKICPMLHSVVKFKWDAINEIVKKSFISIYATHMTKFL